MKSLFIIIRKIRHFLQSRIFITAFVLFFQLILWFFGFYAFSFFSQVTYIISVLISIVIIIYILNKHDNPSYKLSWSIIIIGVPYIGGLIYLLFGNKKVSKKLFNRILAENEELKTILKQNKEYQKNLKLINEDTVHFYDFITNISDYPYYQNTDIKYLKSGEVFFEELIKELKKAKKFIFMEYFIIAEGYMLEEVMKVLKDKVASGVEVYFMYDDGGSVSTIEYKYYLKLKEYGIKAAIFNPVGIKFSSSINNRNHRKITVIDNEVAFMGGANIADEYINCVKRFGHWKDSAIKISGEAVLNCTVMFIQFFNASSKDVNLKYEDFNLKIKKYENKSFVLPFSDTPTDDDLIGRSVHLGVIRRARKYIYIQTPYLILDYEFANALIDAAKSGVEVIITTPHLPDKKSVFLVTQHNYKILLENGIKIYEYKPGFIHSKVLISDDNFGVVGTINLDYRSYYLNYECATLFKSAEVVKEIKKDYLETLAVSKKIELAEYQKMSIIKKFLMFIVRMLSPLL